MISDDLKDQHYEKINTFKVLVENYSDEVAFIYLQKSNWDETVFVIIKKNIFLFKQ